MLKGKIEFWLRLNVIIPAKRRWEEIETGIRNILYWFPIIWKDRNDEPDQMVAILRHKMAAMKTEMQMEKDFTDNASVHLGILGLEQGLRFADRILIEEYEDKVELGRKSIFEEILESYLEPLNDDKVFYLFENMSEGEQNKSRQEAQELFAKARDLRQQDLGALFEVLQVEYDNFWY